MKQIGRNVIKEPAANTSVKLSIISSLLILYYDFRIKLIEKRIKKYASFAAGYEHELFHSSIYMKQSYLHKIEARYKKDELRMLKKGMRK